MTIKLAILLIFSLGLSGVIRAQGLEPRGDTSQAAKDALLSTYQEPTLTGTGKISNIPTVLELELDKPKVHEWEYYLLGGLIAAEHINIERDIISTFKLKRRLEAIGLRFKEINPIAKPLVDGNKQSALRALAHGAALGSDYMAYRMLKSRKVWRYLYWAPPLAIALVENYWAGSNNRKSDMARKIKLFQDGRQR